MIIKIIVCIIIILLDLIAFIYLCKMLAGKNQESSDFRIQSMKLDSELNEYKKKGYPIPYLHSHYEDTKYDIRDFVKETSIKHGLKHLSEEEKAYFEDLVKYIEDYKGIKLTKKKYKYVITRCQEEFACLYIRKNKIVFKTNFNKYYYVRERGTVDPVIMPIVDEKSLDKAKEDIRMILA